MNLDFVKLWNIVSSRIAKKREQENIGWLLRFVIHSINCDNDDETLGEFLHRSHGIDSSSLSKLSHTSLPGYGLDVFTSGDGTGSVVLGMELLRE
jgi:hypothetical protein